MTDYKDGAKTPYYDAMLEEFRKVAAGKGAIGQGELAAQMGKKVTPSFRRAVRNLQREGVIEPFRFYTEAGGYAVGYKVVLKLEQMPLPLFDGLPF